MPVPQIGNPSLFLQQSKKTTTDAKSTPNLFVNAIQSSNLQNPGGGGIFAAKSTGTNPFTQAPPPVFPNTIGEKPDLFKSIKTVDENKSNTVKDVLQPSKSVFKSDAPNPFTKSNINTPFQTFQPKESKTMFANPQESINKFKVPTSTFASDSKSIDPSSSSTSRNPFAKSSKSSTNIFKPMLSRPEAAKSIFASVPRDEIQEKVPSATVSSSLKNRLGQRATVIESETSEVYNEEAEEEAFKEEGFEQVVESNFPTSEKQPKKMERLTSREEVKGLKSIVCERIPQQALNKKVLEKHFSRFGKVTSLSLSTKKYSATIHFEDHKSARKAKDKGKIINPQIPPIGAIFYGRIRKPSGIRTDIDDELAAMAETAPEEFKISSSVFSKPMISKPTFAKPAALTTKQQSSEEQIQQIETRPKISSNELLQIMKSRTFDDAERYNVLDARDKYIRLKLPPKAAEVRLRGCCPDICPEKERYSRAIKNQLRCYEKVNGEVNHRATVKEYSRSAADIDVPLQHELRPSKVLNMAMNHLLSNMIDRIELMKGSMEEW